MRIASICIAYALVLIGIAIGVDRITADALYGRNAGFALSAQSYYHPSVASKLSQVEDLDPGQRDPLFIGNSLTMLDVSPVEFDRRLGELGRTATSYNLAIPSVGVTFWDEFFDRYWREALPKNLVLGVQPRDVNPRGIALTEDFAHRFFDSDNAEDGIPGFAEEVLSDAFVLWQRRGTLFAGDDEGSLPIGDEPGSTDIAVIGPQGTGATGPPFVKDAAELRAERRKELPVEGPPFELDPAAVAALDRLASQQSSIGGKLILYDFPIYFDSEPEGAAGVQADFVRSMADYAASRPDVEFIDVAARTRPQFSAADYVDENHLGRPAARRFSADLADLLESHLSE